MSVLTRRPGAIQAVNAEALFAMALRHDCLLLLNYGIGDFVPPGASLIEVHGTSPPDPARLRELIALGEERTMEQDPAYAVRILVDIAIKALSAAINDPTTAVQMLNYLEAHLQSSGRQISATTTRSPTTTTTPGSSYRDAAGRNTCG